MFECAKRSRALITLLKRLNSVGQTAVVLFPECVPAEVLVGFALAVRVVPIYVSCLLNCGDCGGSVLLELDC